MSPVWDTGIPDSERVLGLGPRAFRFLTEIDRRWATELFSV